MDFKKLIRDLDLQNAKIQGDELQCSCPLAPWTHDKGVDHSPSFSFKKTQSGAVVYNCFACKSKGRIEHLIDVLFMNTRNAEYLAILLDLDKVSNEVEIRMDYDLPHDKILNRELYEYIFEHPRDYIEAREYLIKRNISIETCDRLDIRYDPEEKRIVFLVSDYDNNLVGFVGRSVIGNAIKARNKPGMPIKYVFLGMHKLTLGKPIILVEGLFMYLKLHDLGFDNHYNILAVLGSEISKPKREFLQGLGMPIYMLFDNDKAGNTGAYGVESTESLSNIFKGEGIKGAAGDLCKHLLVYRVIYPEGVTDPDDLSKEQLKNMLDYAQVMRKVS